MASLFSFRSRRVQRYAGLMSMVVLVVVFSLYKRVAFTHKDQDKEMIKIIILMPTS